MNQAQRRRERSFEVGLAVLCDLAAIETVPLSCQCGPTCASACQVEPMPAALASLLKKKVGLGFYTLMFKGFKVL